MEPTLVSLIVPPLRAEPARSWLPPGCSTAPTANPSISPTLFGLQLGRPDREAMELLAQQRFQTTVSRAEVTLYPHRSPVPSALHKSVQSGPLVLANATRVY